MAQHPFMAQEQSFSSLSCSFALATSLSSWDSSKNGSQEPSVG